jgi:hypothetical protein
LELILSWSGGSVTINSASPFAITGAPPGVLDVNISTLNPFLAASGSADQFASLSTSSNSPGTTADAVLSLTGDVFLGSGGGSKSIQVVATDNAYTLPAGPENLLGTATSILTNTASGDTQVSGSWYNPSNTAGAMEQPAGTITFTSHGPVSTSNSGSTPVSSITGLAPYGLTTSATINLTSGEDQFAGTVEVGPNLPEPCGVGLLLISGVLLTRRRGAAA